MLLKTNSSKRKIYLLKAIFWLIAILLGAIQAWANCYSLSTEDGVSYLDVGDAYLRGEWSAAINGYWSPVYSWILGLTISLLKPSAYWEFPVVKLVNFLIYLFALICFEFFVRELIFYYNQKISQTSPNQSFKIPEWVWIASGYSLFICSSIVWITLHSDTPDMCVAALIYLAAGIILRVHLRSDSWFSFIILGLVAGIGYLSKAAMFPIAFVFIIVGMYSVGNLRRSLPRALVALLVFAITVTPFIAALSTMKGHFTFGDPGKLNYAWLVNPGPGVIPDHHWQGGPPGNGTPKHPTHKIIDDPLTFEFATPLGGTYPPWYDPSYWYEGLIVKFNLINQIKVLAKNIFFYYKYFLGTLVFGYLIVVCLKSRFFSSLKDIMAGWRLIVPAVAALCIYALGIDLSIASIETQSSTRYIAPFIVLLFAGVFSSVRLPDSQAVKRLIAGMTVATLILISGQLFYQSYKELGTVLKAPEHTYWQVTRGLNKLGIQSGEKVAIFADEYLGVVPHVFWARLAKVKIVAEIYSVKNFWKKDTIAQSEILNTIQKTGAKVMVHLPLSKILSSKAIDGWQEIRNTGYYAYVFQKQ